MVRRGGSEGKSLNIELVSVILFMIDSILIDDD